METKCPTTKCQGSPKSFLIIRNSLTLTILWCFMVNAADMLLLIGANVSIVSCIRLPSMIMKMLCFGRMRLRNSWPTNTKSKLRRQLLKKPKTATIQWPTKKKRWKTNMMQNLTRFLTIWWQLLTSKKKRISRNFLAKAIRISRIS